MGAGHDSKSSQEVISQKIQENFQEDRFSTILKVGFNNKSQYDSMREFFRENSISYTGLEHTPHFIENVQKLYPEANWIHGDIHNMSFKDNSFDWVLVNNVLEYQKGGEEFGKAVKELCRVARKTIIVVWSQCPTIIKDRTEECDGEISASNSPTILFFLDIPFPQNFWIFFQTV